MTYADNMEIVRLMRENRLLKEQVLSLEHEADNLTERLEKRLDEDSVYRVYHEQVEENQRLREQLEAHHRVGYGLEWGEKCEVCTT